MADSTEGTQILYDYCIKVAEPENDVGRDKIVRGAICGFYSTILSLTPRFWQYTRVGGAS